MTDVLETAGKYRVRLEVQQDQQDSNPRTNQDCNLANVITPTQQRYIDIDENGGPLQEGWDYFSVRPDSEKLFARWALMAHGVTVVVHNPHDGAWGLWYVMPDKMAEVGEGVTPEQIIEGEFREYQAWASGEVYGHVIEKRTHWTSEDDQEMDTWEHVDSCWGYIGREYAEEAAREAFEGYASEVTA